MNYASYKVTKVWEDGSFTVHPFLYTSTDTESISLTIDLTEYVDGYDYHDFPRFIDIYFSKEEFYKFLEWLKEQGDK